MTKVIVATRNTTSRPEFAGWMWVPLQYLLGFERLGLESYWVDRIDPINPYKQPHSLDYLMSRLARTAEEVGFENRYCVRYARGEKSFGLSEARFSKLVESADLLVNLGGYLPPSSDLNQIPRRAFVDVDPGYTQIWSHQGDIGLDRHNSFFTVGQNVNGPDFKVPTQGIEWIPILPPVVLDMWPPKIDEECSRFSTVADWRGSQDAIFDTEYFGTKRSEFIRFLHVPEQARQRIELALCIGQHDYEDLGLLLGHNWRVRDPYMYAGDLNAYREFIQFSRAEFSVAKSGYVKASCGWVSDRTACYLASAKPAIVQSTGFEGSLPTGRGLLTFSTAEEAVKAIEEVNKNYALHCRAARRLAEEHLDALKVLPSILGNM